MCRQQQNAELALLMGLSPSPFNVVLGITHGLPDLLRYSLKRPCKYYSRSSVSCTMEASCVSFGSLHNLLSANYLDQA